MSAFRTDGTFTSASAIGAARKSFPFDGDNSSFIVEQDFMVLLTSFTPLALDTAHPTYTDAYLVKESPLEDLGAGLVKWTRTYAQVPAARDDWGTFAFQFPGLLGTLTPPYSFQYWTVSDDGRDPYLDTAVSRLRHEYYLTATPGSIAILPGLEFNIVSNPSSRNAYLLPAGVYWSNTSPTKEAWIALMAGGAGIGTGANAGEFIAEDSTVERWMGNIYVRKTRYVKAK